jgi:hypothetical protein
LEELKAYLLYLVDVSALISYCASKRMGRGLNWEKDFTFEQMIESL